MLCNTLDKKQTNNNYLDSNTNCLSKVMTGMQNNPTHHKQTQNQIHTRKQKTLITPLMPIFANIMTRSKRRIQQHADYGIPRPARTQHNRSSPTLVAIMIILVHTSSCILCCAFCSVGLLRSCNHYNCFSGAHF
mmetsp:Transcript_450/g.1254  ORF Transcript_450/g.1254 Transcript_450/m.1254 type:complete len:134 (-) Transcript_450:384-785(-)